MMACRLCLNPFLVRSVFSPILDVDTVSGDSLNPFLVRSVFSRMAENTMP